MRVVIKAVSVEGFEKGDGADEEPARLEELS